MKEDGKRRIWSLAISFLVFVFLLPIYVATSLEQAVRYLEDGMTAQDKHWILIQTATKCFGPRNTSIAFITILLAVICGITGFMYLQSKRKVDFYHSLPVKRKELFVSSYVNGLLIYVIPYVIMLGISFVIAAANQAYDGSVWMTAWKTFGINVLGYCIAYSVVIIAVMLTGQLIVSLLACAVFFGYAPMVVLLGRELGSKYFTNYYYQSSVYDSFIFKLSPISSYSYLTRGVSKDNLSGVAVLLYLVVAVALFALALFLNNRRKSDAAGKAISYPKLQPIIKTFVCVPVGLISGIIFTSLTDTNTSFWLIFGMVCGYLLCSFIMEIIYHFDFKAALKSKLQLLIGAVFMFVIFFTFKFDLLHYDTYIPGKNSIETMSISFMELENNHDYRVYDVDNDSFLYMNSTEYANRFMRIKNLDIAYEIGKIAASEEYAVMEEDYSRNKKWVTMTVQYRLRSGRKVNRRYEIMLDPIVDLMDQLYVSDEYKEGIFLIYQMKEANSISCYNRFQNLDLTLSAEERAQLLALYKEELTSLSITDIKAAAPIATIVFRDAYVDREEYIYPTFTKTMTFLTDHGFDFTKTFDLEQVSEVELEYTVPYNLRDQEKYQQYAESHPEMPYDITLNLTKKEEIEQILPYLVESSYAWNNGVLLNYDTYLSITVTTKTDEYGNVDKNQYSIPYDKIPDFVKEAILYAEPDEY